MCTGWRLTGGYDAAPGRGESCPEGGREARPGSDGGLNKQSGLKCTGRAPFTRGPGYRRVYGETTKHASEASVFKLTPLFDRMAQRAIVTRFGLVLASAAGRVTLRRATSATFGAAAPRKAPACAKFGEMP